MKSIPIALLGGLTLLPSLAHAGGGGSEPEGLSLFFQDGNAATVDIVGDGRRYVDELDIVSTIPTATDEGIQPVIDSGDMAGLDWSGVEMVEEDWRPDGQGTFTRQRFYRNAAWMEKRSYFLVYQADDDGVLPGLPIVVSVGKDDVWSLLDSGFIRRFDARQITTGCAAIDDCSTATGYVSEGLAQYRHALFPRLQSRQLRSDATRLIVYWTADPLKFREVQLARLTEEESTYAYGFEPEIEEMSVPANGQYYIPGEQVTFAIRFYDDEGNVIAGDGNMPTYSEFLFGLDDSGLRYYDINLQTTLFYALKHRESNMVLAMSGPTDKLQVPQTVVSGAQFLTPNQAVVATPGVDGFTGLAYLIPNFGVIFGGFADPSIWDTPVPDEYTFTIPPDAEAGTYVVALKARREFGGEALNRGAVVRVQVGTDTHTAWEPTTGNCETCHLGQTSLSETLHGIGDRETCFACHTPLDFEPDSQLNYRVHFVHSRSDRFPGDPWECSTCHLSPPQGPPIGFPGFTYPFE